jgi:hypothetical protein
MSENIQLIYLHNRKAAGTSFKSLMIDTFGTNNVYWKHSDLNKSDIISIENALIVGGHFNIENYFSNSDDSKEKYFISCVRNPIDRVKSLFNHHRTKDNWHDVVNGFDKNSLSNTLKNCKKFIDLIENEQCFMLSGKRDFNSVIEKLEEEKFIIGFQEKLDTFVNTFSKTFNIDSDVLPESNKAVGNSLEGTDLNNTELVTLISYLNEDLKLYEFIKQNIVYTNINDIVDLSSYVLEQEITSKSRSNVIIKSEIKKIDVKIGENISIPLEIINNNKFNIETNLKTRIFSSYHIYDMNNNLILWDGIRTNLPDVLLSNQQVNTKVKILPFNEKGKYIVKIGLLHETISWFESDNINHEISVEIDIKE